MAASYPGHGIAAEFVGVEASLSRLISGDHSPSWSSRWQRFVSQQPFLLLTASAVLGVLLDSACPGIPTEWWLFTAVLGVLVLLLGGRVGKRGFWRNSDRTISVWLSGASVLVTCGSMAALNHRWQGQRYESSSLRSRVKSVSQPMVLEGVVADPAILRSHPLAQQRQARGQSAWQTVLLVQADLMRRGSVMDMIDGRVRVTVNGRCDDLLPGDRIRIFGNLYKPRLPTNPGGRSGRDADRRHRIHGRMQVGEVGQVVLLDRASAKSFFSRVIASVANRGRDVLLKNLSESTGPLAVALVIGQRDFVDHSTRDLLLVTGTAHLLSVSGMHLAIVVTLAIGFAMVFRFPLTAKVIFTLSICLFYTALTGGRPPVMRASVIASVFLFSIYLKRSSQPLNTLGFAACLLIFYCPENLFGIGIQLSFLAVATLLIASGKTGGRSRQFAVADAIANEDRLAALVRSSQPRWIQWGQSAYRVVTTLLWLSLCVTVVSTPLVWYQFHVISPISVITNVVLGPVLFVALASGIVTVIAGMIHPWLAFFPAAGCDLAVVLLREVITTAASIPMSHAWLPSPPMAWVIIFYAGLALTLLLPGQFQWRTYRFRSRSIRYVWIIGLMGLAIVMVGRPSPLPEGTLEATFVDVGHGTCVVIRFDDQVWLYDCGRLGNEQGSSRDIDETLWSLGVTRLDGVMISHADADHFNALPGLLRRFGVNRIITPPGMLAEPEEALVPIAALIKELAIPVEPYAAGQSIMVGDRQIRVLHPPATRIPGSDNANSLVIELRQAGRSVVLPGDLERPGTRWLLKQQRPRVGGVLMAPHHGSLRLDAESVVQWARPAQTVVSGGRLARRPEVTDMLDQYGSRVHVTSKNGAVRVRIGANGVLELKSWLESPW